MRPLHKQATGGQKVSRLAQAHSHQGWRVPPSPGALVPSPTPQDPGKYKLTCLVPPADEVAASSPVGTNAAKGGGRRHGNPEVTG